jgi:hypothetical protein
MFTLKIKSSKNDINKNNINIKNSKDQLIEKLIEEKQEKKLNKQIENSSIILNSEKELKNILK